MSPSTDPEYHEHVAGDKHAHAFNGPHSHGGVSALREPRPPYVLRLTGEQIGSIDPPPEGDWFTDWDEYEDYVPARMLTEARAALREALSRVDTGSAEGRAFLENYNLTRAALDTPAPPRIDPERLAKAMQASPHGTPWMDRVRGGRPVAWKYLTDQQRALVLADAAAIAKAYEEDAG